jgi:hypothetical protein
MIHHDDWGMEWKSLKTHNMLQSLVVLANFWADSNKNVKSKSSSRSYRSRRSTAHSFADKMMNNYNLLVAEMLE